MTTEEYDKKIASLETQISDFEYTRNQLIEAHFSQVSLVKKISKELSETKELLEDKSSLVELYKRHANEFREEVSRLKKDSINNAIRILKRRRDDIR